MNNWVRHRVSRTTIITLIAGIGILALALLLGQAPLLALFSPEAILMVFGGTCAATCLSFKQKTIRDAWSGIRFAFMDDNLTPQGALDYAMDVARFIRDQGMLALQPMLASIELPILRKGLSMVLDNCAPEFIRDSLTTETEVMYRQQADAARVLETAGGYAPTMGIIGAVIGLMHVVQSLQNPEDLGQGVASAFCATLFGVAFANMLLLPMAARLKQQARDEGFINAMLIEAVMSMARREHPLILEEKLAAYVGKESVLAKQSGYAAPQKQGIAAQQSQEENGYNFLDDEFHQTLMR